MLCCLLATDHEPSTTRIKQPRTHSCHRNPMPTRRQSFLHRHSLSIVSATILTAWIILYTRSNPSTHWGFFFGNAIADWSGLLVTVLATKVFFEVGSAESRKPPHHWLRPAVEFLQNHS